MKWSTWGMERLRRAASRTTASARGCSERASRAAVTRKTSASAMPSAETARTPNCPSVSVPVLSKATTRVSRARSKASRLRTKMPCWADMAVAFTMTSGIAKPNACGQAITITGTMRVSAKSGAKPRKSQTLRVSDPAPSAINVRRRPGQPGLGSGCVTVAPPRPGVESGSRSSLLLSAGPQQPAPPRHSPRRR